MPPMTPEDLSSEKPLYRPIILMSPMPLSEEEVKVAGINSCSCCSGTVSTVISIHVRKSRAHAPGIGVIDQ